MQKKGRRNCNQHDRTCHLLSNTPRPRTHTRRAETHMPRPDGRQGALKSDSLTCLQIRHGTKRSRGRTSQLQKRLQRPGKPQLCKKASPPRLQGQNRACLGLTPPRRIALGKPNQRTSERGRRKLLAQDNQVAADAEPPSGHPACHWALAIADEFRGDRMLSCLEHTTVGKTMQEKTHRSLVERPRASPRSR